MNVLLIKGKSEQYNLSKSEAAARGILRKRCSENMQQICRGTPHVEVRFQ